MAKPTSFQWANGTPPDGDPYVIEPSAAKKEVGFIRVEKPKRQHMNWLFNQIMAWVSWFVSKAENIEFVTMLSSDLVRWDGANLVFAEPIDLVFRGEAGARRANRLAAATVALADGQCLVVRRDRTNPSPAVLSEQLTYSNLAVGEFCVVAESSLTLNHDEDELIVFRRRGTVLEVVPLGQFVAAPACFHLGHFSGSPQLSGGNTVTTNNADPTDLSSEPVAEGERWDMEFRILGVKSDGTEMYRLVTECAAYRNAGGDVTIEGEDERGRVNTAAWGGVVLVADTTAQAVVPRATGADDTTIRWAIAVRKFKVE